MDDPLRFLEALANVASIVTAAIAAWAGGWFLYQRRQKRVRLENYLKAETAGNNSLRDVTDVVAELGMTEAEVIDAAIRSRHVERKASANMVGAPSKLLLRYSPKKAKTTRPL